MKWISHPNLPGQELQVPVQAVGHHSMAGWVPLDEPPEWFTNQQNEKARLAGMPVDSVPESSPAVPADKAEDDDADKPTSNKRVRRVTTEESK